MHIGAVGSSTRSWIRGTIRRGRNTATRRLSIDRRALAAFRITLGAVLLLDLGLRARSMTAFYTDAGVLPRATLVELYPLVGHLSLHGLSGTVWLEVILFAIAGIAAFALLVGYRTRVATAASLVLLLSLHARNPLVLNAGDSLLRQLLFWGLLLPLGDRWSLDAGTTDRMRTRVTSVASAGLLLQVVLVYVVNAAIKFRGGLWIEGTALRHVFSLDRFTILLGDVLAETPWLLAPLERAWLVMLVGSGLLVVLRGYLRAGLAGLFVLAHLGMALTLALGVFPLVSIVALLPFFPAPVWDAVERRIVSPLVPALSRIRSWVASSVSVGRRASVAIPFPDERGRRRIGTAVAALALVVMLGYNGTTVTTGTFASAENAGLDVGEPRWRMFAPNPPSIDGWYVVRGELGSGETIDALHGGTASFDRPPDLARTYPSARWRKFLTKMRARDDPTLYRSVAAHVCGQWRQRGLQSVDAYFVAERTVLGGPDPRERQLLGSYDCGSVSPT